MFCGVKCVDKVVKIQVMRYPQAVTRLVRSLLYCTLFPFFVLFVNTSSANVITIFYLSFGLIPLDRHLFLRPLALSLISCWYFVNIEISHFLHF